MPPRLNILSVPRATALRTRTPIHTTRSNLLRPTACRTYASDRSSALPPAEGEEAKGPNMSQQEHVSEEAAKMAKITGSEGPDLDVGTPVQDILKEDPEARKDAPQVMKDSIKAKQPSPKPQTRSFSTMTRRQQELVPQSGADALPPMMAGMSLDAFTGMSIMPETNTVPAISTGVPEETTGHKWPLPSLPLPSNMHKDYRYDPVIKQITNLMMKDGKLSVAQRNMSMVLQYLRTASPPTYSASRPLLPGARK